MGAGTVGPFDGRCPLLFRGWMGERGGAVPLLGCWVCCGRKFEYEGCAGGIEGDWFAGCCCEGSGELLTDGEDSDVVVDVVVDGVPVPLKRDLTSIFGLGLAGVAVVGEGDDDGTEASEGLVVETGELPFTVLCGVAGTEPKVLTPSDLMGGTETGEEEMGAVTSSIDPNVTGEALLAAPTLLRLMLTPSLMGMA